MMLNKEQMIGILKELRSKTADHKMAWYGEGDQLCVDLPNRMAVSLARKPDGGLTASVKRGPAEVLGSVEFSPAQLESDLAEIKTLYDAASTGAVRIVYEDILDAIKLSDSAAVEVGRNAPTVVRVPPDQANRVLKKMSGRWNLDFSRGQEKAEIREDGSYILSGKELKFRLVVLAVNEDTSTVEVGKDTPDGRRYQIEYLTITPDKMIGHAKHDGHKLSYTRTKS